LGDPNGGGMQHQGSFLGGGDSEPRIRVHENDALGVTDPNDKNALLLANSKT
jgi:hypothetical protein